MREKIITFLCVILMVCISGCGNTVESQKEFLCHMVIEQGEGFSVEDPAREVAKGGDITYRIQMTPGYVFEKSDYPEYSVVYENSDENYIDLTLHQVMYSTAVTIDTQKSDLQITYHANGGTAIVGNTDQNAVCVPVVKTHIRINTDIGTDLFQRQGYTLVGWNTKQDGSGTWVGLGSRIQMNQDMVLYAQWSEWNDSSEFTYQQTGEQLTITGYSGNDQILSIPGEINGKKVTAIEEDAFCNNQAKTVIIPKEIISIEAGAFRNAAVEELYLYDSISFVNDYSFENCNQLQTLHINAIEKPVYSGTYYDTFQDKYDRLCSIKNQKKIVLFSGSSTRFGYDSVLLDQAFPAYDIVNMGVFAYTNARPQMLLILENMNQGDILLDSPEFDAAKRQFCTTTDLDEAFFCMMESNYDTLAQLDLRECSKVFSSFYTYLHDKEGMTPKSYQLSADNYDEDGNTSTVKTYNQYGDYCVYRPNAESDEPVYGLKVGYTINDFPKDYFIEPLNQMYERFLEKGIHVYFTYAPRNREAISDESTKEARAQLDQYFRDNFEVPVISDIEESLVSGIYLYGTDNHLTTQGAEKRTQAVINELKAEMQQEGISDE